MGCWKEFLPHPLQLVRGTTGLSELDAAFRGKGVGKELA